MQRPSSAKLWHIPQPVALPIPEEVLRLDVPLEAQDTSYLADSASIFNFSKTASFMLYQFYPYAKERIKLELGIRKKLMIEESILNFIF